jgi:enoyl-CoA hydratase
MRLGLAALLREADADPSVQSIIITGAGGAFSSGVDLKESEAYPGPPVRPNPGEAIRALGKPTIAAVDGPCVTGGLEIALSCSFVIASDRASFADTHAKVGKFPAWGLSALLPRAIGVRRARQLALTGMFIDARTACDWGLINEVTPANQLLSRCLQLADAIAKCDRRSVMWQLDILRSTDGLSLNEALAAENAAIERWRADAKNSL